MKQIFLFSLSLILFTGEIAKADLVKVLDLKLRARRENWQTCAYEIAQNVKAKLFIDNDERKFNLGGYTYRPGIDGYKFWFRVTETQRNGSEAKYFINMRIKFEREFLSGQRTQVTNRCEVDMKSSYPLYVTNERGETLISLDGQSMLSRASERFFDAIFSTPPPKSGYNFLK